MSNNTPHWTKRLKYPITDPYYRVKIVAEMHKCPQCGNDLDTGWECNDRSCLYDARSIAYPEGRKNL